MHPGNAGPASGRDFHGTTSRAGEPARPMAWT